MASAIIHMCVAKKVNEKLNMDIRLLSLGSIAPDSGKYFTGSKEVAHFIKDVPNMPEMDDFLNKYKNYLNKPFEMGYYIHLLTDKYWFDNFVEDRIAKYNEKFNNTLRRKDILKVIYNDYSILNVPMISEYNPYIEIFMNEFDEVDSVISEIPCFKFDIFVNEMSKIVMEEINGDCEILKYDEVCDFIEECSNLILLDIKKDLGVDYGENL